jgi:hypothetical protein
MLWPYDMTMSSTAEPIGAAPVTSMREMAEDTVRSMEEVDRYLHQQLNAWRTRAYALKLAEDPEFAAERERMAAEIADGRLPAGQVATLDDIDKLLKAERSSL